MPEVVFPWLFLVLVLLLGSVLLTVRVQTLEARVKRLQRGLDSVAEHVGFTLPESTVGSPSAAVLAFLDQGRKIEAIKQYRVETGAGLKDAKEAVEAFERGHR
jgi:large subunit ribosomal protein L7/L12